jgi:trans-aconitate 2-methyltransferase
MRHIWDAKDYCEHSFVQKFAAIELLMKIKLSGSERVLDVGCGDGKISAQISRQIPNGQIIGIDISSEMIEFAIKSFSQIENPNLFFLVQDAHNFNFSEEFNVIFSSFCLQWVSNPRLFFECANNSLKKLGIIAVTVPLGISAELEESLNWITSLPVWNSYFKSFVSGWHFMPQESYRKILSDYNFNIQMFNVIDEKVVFSSRIEFEKYISQWLSYLNPIPEELKNSFLKKVVDKYLTIIPVKENGKVDFCFQRLDFLAQKTII